jgi:hypothetical protein
MIECADPAPLLVTPKRAQQILGVGNTKFWELVKTGEIATVKLGPQCTRATYASLTTLVQRRLSESRGQAA